MAKVKVLKGFESGIWGNREVDDSFDYPVTEDPARLIADGFVEREGGGAKKPELDK